MYEIAEARPGPNGEPVKDQGWRVYQLTYAQSHMGNAIKRKRAKQQPYRRLVAVCASSAEAQEWIDRRKDELDNLRAELALLDAEVTSC